MNAPGWPLRVAAVLAGSVVLLIFIFLLLLSIPALQHIGPLRFFTDKAWLPFSDNQFRLYPMVLVTLAVTAGAVLIAAPLGVASALFLRYYAPGPVTMVYRHVLQLLAGIPSVIYGLWGLTVLVPIVTRFTGHGILPGVLVLSIMILPTVALLSENALAAVPADLIRGAAALGLSRWSILKGVVFPSAWPGVLTAVVLAVGRAMGETMAVLMVCGNVANSDGLLGATRTLTANIALELEIATGLHLSALFVCGLILLSVSMLLVFGAERLNRRKGVAHAGQ